LPSVYPGYRELTAAEWFESNQCGGTIAYLATIPIRPLPWGYVKQKPLPLNSHGNDARDTNGLGSIFGGHILSLIDLAAGQHARMVAPLKYVTKIFREVEFIAPVAVGDVVSFYCKTERLGTTSITIAVDVEVERGENVLKTIKVTSAEVVMVAVDGKQRPIPIMGRKRTTPKKSMR